MKVVLTNSTLTIKTGIKAALLGDRRTVTLKDEKGNEVYAVSFSNGGDATMSKTGMLTNAVVDGELAIVKVAPTQYTLKNFRAEASDDLLEAYKALPQLAAQLTAEKATLDSMFADILTEATEAAEATEA